MAKEKQPATYIEYLAVIRMAEYAGQESVVSAGFGTHTAAIRWVRSKVKSISNGVVTTIWHETTIINGVDVTHRRLWTVTSDDGIWGTVIQTDRHL